MLIFHTNMVRKSEKDCMDKNDWKIFWEAYENAGNKMGAVNDGVGSGPEKPLDERNTPLEAVVIFKGGNAYQAEIWETRQAKVSPITEYVYWIMIIDKNFLGRIIPDSKQDESITVDVKFNDMYVRNLEGFRFRHLAGSLFRVKFRMDSNQSKVVSQDLTMYGRD